MPVWKITEKKHYYQLSSTFSSFSTQLRYRVRDTKIVQLKSINKNAGKVIYKIKSYFSQPVKGIFLYFYVNQTAVYSKDQNVNQDFLFVRSALYLLTLQGLCFWGLNRLKGGPYFLFNRNQIVHKGTSDYPASNDDNILARYFS